jgi:hypothetical protein
MSAFKRINKSDIVTLPYVANKQWNFTSGDINSSSIYIYTGQKISGIFHPDTEPLTYNNQYQRLVYDSVNQQFYQAFSGSLIDDTRLLQSNLYESASIYGATSSYDNSHNISYDVSYFPEDEGSTIQVIKIPTSIYGEAVNPNTFNISASTYNISDDGYGNLKDSVSASYVGNIFYEHGVAVITNPYYQSYFTSSTLVPLNWSNFNTPYEYNINDTLSISINGIEKVRSSVNNKGRFVANVGDIVSVVAGSDGTWPISSSLEVDITGQTSLFTTGSGMQISSSFTLADQTPISISSFTNFSIPVKLYWINSSPASILHSVLQIYVNGVMVLVDTASNSGSLYVKTGDNVEAISFSPDAYPPLGAVAQHLNMTGASSVTGTTGSYYAISSSLSVLNTNDINVSTYFSNASSININYSIIEAASGSVYFIDAGLNVYDNAMTQIVGNIDLGGTGSFQLLEGTAIIPGAYSFTNDFGSASYWASYHTASLSGSLYGSDHLTVLSSGSMLLHPNLGTQQAYFSPAVVLQPGSTYYLDVHTTTPY